MNNIKLFISLILRSLGGVLGWIFIAPVAYFVPKRNDWIAVYGQHDGRFLDNAKYFFLQAEEYLSNTRTVFISSNKYNIYNLQKYNRELITYPSLKSIIYLLRCSVIVVDHASWHKGLRFFLLINTRKIQLWHGIPFKKIELSAWKSQKGQLSWASSKLALKMRLFFYKLTGRLTKYSLVISPSLFYKENSFTSAFLANNFPIIGYPRNDFAQSLTGDNLKLAWRNVDSKITGQLAEWVKLNKKLVVVAPTFRDSGAMPMQLESTALKSLSMFAEKHNVEFLFKFHPLEKNAETIAGQHFHICARDSDIYPLLPYAAALVTDYSSISMDFLWVDKPLVFLIPDNDDYAEKDRQLQFDPRAMMPGPVIPDWISLQTALLREWGEDNYAPERASLRSKAFDDLPQADATTQLISIMREQGWIK